MQDKQGCVHGIVQRSLLALYANGTILTAHESLISCYETGEKDHSELGDSSFP